MRRQLPRAGPGKEGGGLERLKLLDAQIEKLNRMVAQTLHAHPDAVLRLLGYQVQLTPTGCVPVNG